MQENFNSAQLKVLALLINSQDLISNGLPTPGLLDAVRALSQKEREALTGIINDLQLILTEELSVLL